MDAAWSRRLRWRRRGAWLWPVFIAATVADAVIGTLLPPSGDSQMIFGAGVIGLVLNMIGILVISWPAAALLRRRRRDLPVIVARDYAGTAVVALVSVALLSAGLLHRNSVLANRRAMQDAIVRAQAYIGDRAPAEFRRNVQWVSTFTIEPGSIYRACVPSLDGRRTYCVVVDTSLPFERSVRFSGYESNATFSTGVN
jgi:uncharacterized membrane protein YhaH (DUF805 family)